MWFTLRAALRCKWLLQFVTAGFKLNSILYCTFISNSYTANLWHYSRHVFNDHRIIENLGDAPKETLP
jgi:hypothetical protein